MLEVALGLQPYPSIHVMMFDRRRGPDKSYNERHQG